MFPNMFFKGPLIICNVFAFVLCYGDYMGDLDIKQKQLFVFKLLNHNIEPNFYQDVLNISKEFKIEDNLESFTNTEYVKEFAKSFHKGQHPRGEIFCLFCEKQLQQAIRTFLVLYYANNFSTFLKTSCWLRQNINEGLFAYAFSVALRHRDDCRSFILPSIYEIYPFFFVAQNTVQKAAMVKMEMNSSDDQIAAYYGIKKLNYPFWMGDEIYGLTIDRRGELYIYLHRQLLARYYLERLSNGLCHTESFEWNNSIDSGFHPGTTFHNGWALPLRPNNVKIGKDKIKILKEINNFENRLRDAILNGFIISYDGAKINMRKAEGIEVLGRKIYGNLDKRDRDLLYFYELVTRELLSQTLHINGVHVPTSSLQFYETALQDPVFWQLQRSTMELMDKFDHGRSAHRRDDLFFAGVKISSVGIGKLVTYFDENNIDITNSVFMNAKEANLKMETLNILARKYRINHGQFDVVIHVQSDKTTSCVVRMYLGPKEDCYGRLISIEEHRHNFVELDTFVHTLNIGNNSITRHSSDFNNVIEDREFARDLWKLFASKEYINITSYLHRHSGFPDNLVLPKGSKGGHTFTLFVIISPLEKQRTYSGFNMEEMRAKKLCRFNLCVHSAPLGFPFNKKIDREILTLPNARFMDVIIFHKNKKDVGDNLTVIHPFA